MIKVLEKAGCTVSYNPRQTCCGQAAFNAGYWEEAKEVCQKFIADFKGIEPIVVPSASCGGFVKNYYARLFDNSSVHHEVQELKNRVIEFSSFLYNNLGATQFGARLKGKATYHDSCAALRECGIKTEPRELLKKVEGLELIEMNETETCCGFGGTFAVSEEAVSCLMGRDRVADHLRAGAEVMTATDMSCLMHLDGLIRRDQKPLRCLHIAQLLAGRPA